MKALLAIAVVFPFALLMLLAEQRRAIAIALLLALAPSIAHAEDEPAIVPIAKDAPAPFEGLLVPELRFTSLLEAENEVNALRAKLAAHERADIEVEKILTKKLAEPAPSPSWYESTEFNRWLGFAIGVVVTCGAIYAGSLLVK